MAFQIVNESTLSAIVQNVAGMVAFPVPADPAGDTDPAVQQMVQATNMAGLELLTMYDWQELIKNYEIPISSTYTGQNERGFSLPEDFLTGSTAQTGMRQRSSHRLDLSPRKCGSNCLFAKRCLRCPFTGRSATT